MVVRHGYVECCGSPQCCMSPVQPRSSPSALFPSSVRPFRHPQSPWCLIGLRIEDLKPFHHECVSSVSELPLSEPRVRSLFEADTILPLGRMVAEVRGYEQNVIGVVLTWFCNRPSVYSSKLFSSASRSLPCSVRRNADRSAHCLSFYIVMVCVPFRTAVLDTHWHCFRNVVLCRCHRYVVHTEPC